MPADISHVVTKLHDAGLAPEAWSDAMKALTEVLGIAGAACVIFGKKTRRAEWVCFSGLSAEYTTKYVDRYDLSDPFSPLLTVTPGWTRLSQCLPKSVLARSEWYNEFVLPCGVHDMLGSRIFDSPSHYVIVGLHERIGRSPKDGTASVLANVEGVMYSAMSHHVANLFGPTSGDVAADEPRSGERFYFHVCNGRTYLDKSGTVFPGRAEAMAHGWKIAAELGQDKVWNGFSILLADEDGSVIARLPVPR